jgi:NADH:ubiquinone oxidoreductase subunit H
MKDIKTLIEKINITFPSLEIPSLLNMIEISFSQIFICALLKIVCILIGVAYFTIAERKVMAAIQRRKGPNVVGF